MISNSLRKLGLLFFFDYLVYYLNKWKNRAKNRSFRKENPGVVLPPDYLIYESFQIDYAKYYTDSIGTARWISELIRQHSHHYNINVLDWGCGPGRIIRHLPDLLGSTCFYYGVDYNPASIAWCSRHIDGVIFSQNKLTPPLDFSEGFFHAIYGISIFTHLSESLHNHWMEELYRVLVPGGILIVTTQGAAFLPKLSQWEKARFANGQLVVRGEVKEGHRTFSAFQPESYMRNLAATFEIVKFTPGDQAPRPQQDVWILKRPSR